MLSRQYNTLWLANEHNTINTQLRLVSCMKKRIWMAKKNEPENTNLKCSCSSNFEEFLVVCKQNLWIWTERKYEDICFRELEGDWMIGLLRETALPFHPFSVEERGLEPTWWCGVTLVQMAPSLPLWVLKAQVFA